MAERQMHSTRVPLEPLNKLKNWPITEALESWLDRIGFGFLSKLNQHKPQIKIDRKLVEYIVSFYNKDSYFFEFNGIQLFFSLIDVYMLTGLPVSGKPVLGHTDDPIILFNKAFPSSRIEDYKTETAIFGKGKIKTTWLHNRFSSLQVNEGDPLWDEYRRAFMLWCISSYIVPDASTGLVEIEYTTVLGDLEDIGNYAWGAAAWATMQHQLKSRKLNGMAFALVVFMVLRVQPLHDLLLGYSGEQPIAEYQFPLILSYLTPLTKSCNSRCCLKNMSYDFLATVRPDQVNPNPYTRFPPRCKDQLFKACSKTLCFNRVVVEPHEPNRIPGQFGFVEVVVDPDFSHFPDIKDQLPKKGPKKCRDLSKEYARFTKFWNDRSPLRGPLLDNWEVQPWMEEYQGDIVMKDASNSRRKLLILDINGLLADIVEPIPRGNKFCLRVGSKAVFKRPHCEDFMLFCLERFDVGIWSSKTKKNVDSILARLLSFHTRFQLKFCWDQSNCTVTNLKTPESGNKFVMYKEIKKLSAIGGYDESNTLLVDDSPYKAYKNSPNTAIFPKTYSYKNLEDDSLGPEGDLRVYLEGLALAENVQEYVKNHPFGQRPINNDPDQDGSDFPNL